ncbi:hypothetical protein IWW45_006687, partial [Coemansia sp. RSA 485]
MSSAQPSHAVDAVPNSRTINENAGITKDLESGTVTPASMAVPDIAKPTVADSVGEDEPDYL